MDWFAKRTEPSPSNRWAPPLCWLRGPALLSTLFWNVQGIPPGIGSQKGIQSDLESPLIPRHSESQSSPALAEPGA